MVLQQRFERGEAFGDPVAHPHVAFGLRLKKVGSAERRRRAGEMLDLVGLSAQADRYAHQMSGGQQQRVALARALAIRPTVLLLDEPLSALDAKVRVQLRDVIRRIQLEVGTTSLFVTHDQEEALAVADRVGVMRAGRLEQIAAPDEVYSRPSTAFVADFVGLTNRVPGVAADGTAEVLGGRVPLLAGSPHHGPVTVLLRPESIGVRADAAGTGEVVTSSFLGSVGRVQVRTPDGAMILAQVATSEVAHLASGTRVELDVRPVYALAVARE